MAAINLGTVPGPFIAPLSNSPQPTVTKAPPEYASARDDARNLGQKREWWSTWRAYKAALGVACGAGLCVSEVANSKIFDIDSNASNRVGAKEELALG